MDLLFEPLAQRHDRAAFLCGEDAVDRFLKEYAIQRAEIRSATTIVAARLSEPTVIVGFYTLVVHEFRGDELPAVFRKRARVGSLTAVPGVLLAQLGVDLGHQRQGIGSALVLHALRRCARLAEDYGAVAIVTDPVDARAHALYTSFDFEPLDDDTPRLILPMKKLVTALNAQVRLDTLTELAEQRYGMHVKAWLEKAHPSLGGRSPRECCGTDHDLDRAIALLGSA